MNNEGIIQKLRTEHPEAEKGDGCLGHEFQVSKHTQQAVVDFLKENDVEIELWIDDLESSAKFRKILKVFFLLNSNYNKEEWCQFPQILQDDAFLEQAKEVLQRDAAKLSKYLPIINKCRRVP
jgi:hypothetical protein